MIRDLRDDYSFAALQIHSPSIWLGRYNWTFAKKYKDLLYLQKEKVLTLKDVPV